MKKAVTLWLAVVMAFCLAACSAEPSVSDTGTPTESNQPLDPQSDFLAFLEAAGEKLKNADSFETTVKKWDDAIYGQQYSPEEETQCVKIQYVANLNGAPASYQEWNLKNQWFYYSGKSGFSGTLSDGEHIYTHTHVCDENFTPLQHFSLLEFTLDLRSSTMFDTVCQFNHTVTTSEDGITTIEFEGLNGEDLLSVTNITSPFFVGWHDDNRFPLVSVQKPIVEGISYNLSFSVDAQGYLCEIRVIRIYTASSGPDVSQTCAISFAHINQKMPFEEAGYTDQFRLTSEQTRPDVFHHFGDFYTAEYAYKAESGTYDVYWLCYIGTEKFDMRPTASQEEFFDKNVIHHYYKILSSIDGILVSEKVNLVGGADIDRLIIPKNLYMLDDGYSEGVEMMFFEEERETYYNSDVVRQRSDYDLNTNCYFAGEWEYVDGVPTPIE